MPVVSAVAGLRGRIAAAEHGLAPEELALSRKATRRKVLSVVVAEVLRGAGERVAATVAQDRARIDEAERVCRQLVARGVAQGSVPPSPPRGAKAQEQLKETWKRLARDPEAGQYVSHTEGLVGPHDALVLLDRCMTTDRR